MNFSNTNKIRKLMSLILVLVLMVSLFAGCKKDDTTADKTEPNVGPNLVSTTPSESQTQPAETQPVINENMATVVSQMNIRSSPSTESTVVGNLSAGDKVEVNRRETVTGINWAYITYPEAGWIIMDYVEMDFPTQDPENAGTASDPESTASTEPEATAGANTENIKGVVTTGLNIRSEASKDGKIQGAYNKGDVITILEVKDGWGRTSKGWIKMEYVNTSGTGNNTTTNTNTNTGNTNTGNGSTTVQFKGIVTASELNIRSTASTDGDRVGSLKHGARVEILEKSGNWGRTKDGWISLDHVYQDGTTGKNTAKGIVTGNELNVRSGPGTNYASVGSLKAGTRVNILEQFTYNGTTWGCTKDGWISLQYVYVDGTGTDKQTGVVIADDLNIRSGPGTNYESVGSLDDGDEVTILFEVTVGDTVWGNIKKGWISMDYVELD